MSQESPCGDRLDDFEGEGGPFEYECPRCRASVGRFADRCEKCGQDLGGAYSAMYRPRRTAAVRIAAAAVLVLFICALVMAMVYSIREIIAGRP